MSRKLLRALGHLQAFYDYRLKVQRIMRNIGIALLVFVLSSAVSATLERQDYVQMSLIAGLIRAVVKDVSILHFELYFAWATLDFLSLTSEKEEARQRH